MYLNIYKLSVLFFVLVIATGCSVAVRKNKADGLTETFRSGDIPTSIEIVQTTTKNQNALYSLEMGQLYRLDKNPRIDESTKNLLDADLYIENWHETFNEKVRANFEILSAYLVTEGFNSDYTPKNYEASILSQYLALNHLSQGNWSLAMVEAKKMALREKLIEAITQEKVLMIEKANENSQTGIDFSKTKNTIESINGYPVALIKNPEVNKLKNSYQNAAVYYLSAFLFESQGETSLAAPGYRLALELQPNASTFKEGLRNLESNVKSKANKDTADTLFIVESGFLPKMESYKYAKVFNFGLSPKLLTISYPTIPRMTEAYKPSAVLANQKNINLELAANIDAMARKELQDDMPAYITRAISRAIAAVGAQALVETAAKSKSNNAGQNAAVGIAGIILSETIANGMQSLNTADVRHWQTLPAYTYVARSQIQPGKTSLQFALPNGANQIESVNLQKGYNVVYIRMFRNKASISISKPSSGNV